MSGQPGERSAPVRIGLIAGGPDGVALLQLLLGWPSARVVVAVDPLPDALVLQQAKSRGIPAATRHLEVFGHLPVDLVIESTGQAAILDEFLRTRPPGIEVIGARSLPFLRVLLRDLTESLEQQAAAGEILRIISSSPTDVQPVLEAVVEHAARLCDVPDADLFRVEGEVLRLAAKIGPHPFWSIGEAAPINRDWVTGRAVVDRKLVHVHDLSTSDAEFPQGAAYAKRYGHRTTLATPLLREGVPIGAILLRGMELRPFTDKQIQLLETFAAQAVIAIENARLFKELEQRNRDLTETLEQQTATGEILRVISSSPDRRPAGLRHDRSRARSRLCDGSQCRRLSGSTATYASTSARHGPSHGGSPPFGADSRALRAARDGHRAPIRAPSPIVHIADDLVRSLVSGSSRWRTAGRYPRPCSACAAAPRRQRDRRHRSRSAPRVRPFSETQIALLQTFADSGGHRHRERPPVQGTGGPQPRSHRDPRAADGHRARSSASSRAPRPTSSRSSTRSRRAPPGSVKPSSASSSGSTGSSFISSHRKGSRPRASRPCTASGRWHRAWGAPPDGRSSVAVSRRSRMSTRIRATCWAPSRRSPPTAAPWAFRCCAMAFRSG